MTPRSAGPRWALLLLLVLGAARTAAAGEPQLWFLNSLAKPAPVQPSAALLAQFETSPVLHAAWGESEALQLLVLGPPEGLNKLQASCGEFTHPSGDVWAPGTVRCDFVGYVTTQAPYYGTTRVGEWPDPLLPDHAIHVAGGRAQPIWIEVKVPLDAEAGRYEGAITLSADGWTATLPLAVEVWGFDLPKSPTLASSFLLRVRYLYEQHHVERASPAAEALILQYHEAMLDHRIMPTHVATDEIRFGDNDQLAAMVAPLVGADLVILLTDVEGVLDDRGKRISVMTPEHVIGTVKKRAASVGSGGMQSKLDAAGKGRRAGATVVVASAFHPEVVRAVLGAEDVGTLFPRTAEPLRARKHWIAFTLRPRGTVILDEGAVRAIAGGKSSLLPVGVLGIRGQFNPGDSVRLVGADGVELGRGLARLGAVDVARAAGKRGPELELLFGAAARDLVIVHKDDLVLAT